MSPFVAAKPAQRAWGQDAWPSVFQYSVGVKKENTPVAQTVNPQKVSRSERARCPEYGGGQGRQGGLRGGTSTKPRDTCQLQKSGFKTCFIRKVCLEKGLKSGGKYTF